MKNPFFVNIKGLKCDTPGCGYILPGVRPEEYESYLETLCPNCGAHLLTEADLDTVKAIMSLVDWGNATVGPVDDAEPQVIVPVEMDGSGSVTLGEPRQA